jgi:hypothetical protein
MYKRPGAFLKRKTRFQNPLPHRSAWSNILFCHPINSKEGKVKREIH